MRDEPDIIKELKEEESKGLLYLESSSYETEEIEEDDTEINFISFLKQNKNVQDFNELETLEDGIKKIFENYFVGITIADEKERIISWNKYAEHILEMDEKDLYLRNVSTLYPPDEWDKIRAENVRKKGIKYKLETKMLRKNGTAFDVEISLCILKGYNGKIIGSIGLINDISSKKKIEKELNIEKNLFESLLDNIPDSIYFKDKEYKYTKVNKAKAENIGKKPIDFIGKNDFEIYPEEEAKKIIEEDKKVINYGKEIINKIVQIKDFNGIKHWYSVTKIPRFNNNGEITGLMGINREITNVKESEKKYKSLFETAIDPIIVIDNNNTYIDVNNQITNILGYKKEEIIGKKINQVNILSKESEKIVYENYQKRMKGENIPPYEIQVISKSGEIIPAEINACALYENNQVVGDLVIIRDLRERYKNKKIEKELFESEKKFKDIFDATSDFLIYLENEIVLDINDTALKLSNLDKKFIIGNKISNLKTIFSEKDLNKHLKAINKANQGEQVQDYETKLSTSNYELDYLFSIDSIRYEDHIKGVVLRGRDITQRQRAWKELVKLEEKYRILAETSADGVITIDNLGRLTYINPSFEKMIQRRKSQVLATLFRDYLSDDSVYFFQQLFIDARKKKEKIENVEFELILPDSETTPIEVNISPVEKNKVFSGLVCTIRDITERRRVEDELKKSERLKTEFMNIAAHELKSPVTPIKGYLDLIISDEKSSEHIKNWAKISLRNAERLLTLVNDILDVSRLDTDTMRFDMEKLSPEEILNEIVEDMKPVIENKGLKFITNIPKQLPNIMGDRYRLSQVLKNIFVNAIKFTDNGSIEITTKKLKDHIHIIIKDTGIGISDNEIKKVFNKFYQAYTGHDRKNEGTGLGLFICKEIIKKHNGDIWVESKIRQGSTFHIKLPYIHKMVFDLKK